MQLCIRLVTVDDARAVQAIYAPAVRETAISFEYEVPSAAEMAERIQHYLLQYPWLVLELDGILAGYAYASAHRARQAYQWSAEVSVYVHPDYQRRGVGRALYTSLFELLRLQGYYQAFAGITLPNPGSVGLHEALGFQPVGVFRAIGYKLDAWHDVGWWQLPLQILTDEPAPPQSFQAIRDSTQWELPADVRRGPG